MATLAAGEKHQDLLDELLAEIAEYAGTVDTELVTRAFRFAAMAHEGQQRRSGEPFIMHPVGVAKIFEGVTKLTRIQFQSREQAEAENYRKMVVAMSEDVRVILIKLADRLHNLRTIEYLGKQKQIQKSKETLEVY